MNNKIDITALTPELLASLLSSSFRRAITEEQVRTIAEMGDLLSEGDTINLLQYTAYLTKESGNSNG